MINFYKANPRVTGTACSFYLNPRDNVFFSTMIKQDSWNDKKRIGSFSKNKDNPSKKVNVKFSPMEIAGIIDAFESNREFSGYHGSNQIVKFKFCPYLKDGKQIGFSYSVNKESKEDSTDKTNFIIGFNFGNKNNNSNLSAGAKLCNALQEMGTTFIKLGQFLATRPDIIGEDISKELEKLQDKLPAFDLVVAKNILKKELGKENFDQITNISEPIAAASIAQVHFANINILCLQSICHHWIHSPTILKNRLDQVLELPLIAV